MSRNNHYAIWDLDNCLSNDQWRINTIDFSTPDMDKRYRRYHNLCHADLPCNKALFLTMQELAEHHVFFTARPELVRKRTELWIISHLPLRRPRVLMRPDGDLRKSPELKRDMFAQLNIEPAQVIGAFDDRPDIISMYRALGLPAALVKIHDSCAYTKPQPTKVTQ